MKLIVAGEKMARLLEKHRRLIDPSPELAIMGAVDGQQILDLHREHRARLLILDTEMPGLAPEQICFSVRADREMRRVSLIVLGTKNSVDVLERCLANRSFARPLQQDDFLGAVRSLINVSARTDYRVLMSLQLEGKVKGSSFFGKSENVSSTGILFTSNRKVEVGDIVELMFVLPGQGRLDTKSRILRVEVVPGRGPRYGAQFIDPARQVFRMLEDFINKRLG